MQRWQTYQPALPQTERDDHYRLLMGNIRSCVHNMLNRLGGAFAVETRFPFFDKRLIEFCLALPPEQKLHQGWSRIILRRAMTGILPREIQWRPGKSNLHPGFEPYLANV